MAGTVFSPLRGAAETVPSPFSQRVARRSPTTATSRPRTTTCAQQLEELEGDAVLEEDAASQLAELLEQQDLEWVGDIDTTTARVLSSDPSNFSHTIDISKGSDDGLKVGMPVVNGAGLVGRIVQVTPSRSTVQLITDPDFLVGVRLARQRARHRHRARAGPGRGPPRRHAPRAEIDDPPEPGTRSPRAVRSSRLPRLDPGGQGAHGPRGRRRAHARARRAADGRHRADAFVTVLLWEPPSDPAQPAHGRGAHVVRARSPPSPSSSASSNLACSACRPT